MISCAWTAAPIIAMVLVAPLDAGAAPAEVEDTDSDTDGDTDTDDEGLAVEVVGTIGIPDRDDPAEREMSAEEAVGVAGAQGDPIRGAQTVAGVGRSAPGGDGLVLWGASPSDTRRYIDDVPVPRLFHTGGVRSVLPAKAVDAISVIPAGQQARYGRGVGGVLAVRTAEPPASRAGGWLAADPIDVGAGAHARWQGGWAAGHVRIGVLDRVASAVVPSRSAAVYPIPRYGDGHVRVQQTLTSGDTLRITALGSDDGLVREIASNQPDTAFSERTRRRFGRVAASIDRQRGEEITRMLVWAGVDRDEVELDYGSVLANDARRRSSGGLLLRHARTVSERVRIQVGLDGEASMSTHERSGAIALPPREGDVRVFGQPPGDRRNADTWSVAQVSLAGFATAVLDGPHGMTLAPGLRIEPAIVDGDRVLPVRPSEPSVGLTQLTVNVDPRVRFGWAPGERRVELFVVGAGVHQAPDPADLSPVFGSPWLSPMRGWQGVVGLGARPVSWLRVDLVGFATRQQELAVRAPSPTPPLAGVLVSEGSGRVEGAQASIRAVRRGLSARVAYTGLRARRRGAPGAVDGAGWRPYDRDQPHALQVLAGARLPLGFELGARAELASGFPRTPVIGAVFDTASQGFDPVFGATNAERLPTFFAASARLSWKAVPARGEYLLWLDVQNLTNRKNVEEWAFASDYRSRLGVRGSPLIAVVGAQVSL